MANQFVDFKVVKECVSMEMVLARYGVKVSVSGKELRGKCPLPQHSSKDSKLSFSVDPEKNAWACLSKSCAAARGRKGGNVLDFVAAMEKCQVKEAALKIAGWFSIKTGESHIENNGNAGDVEHGDAYEPGSEDEKKDSETEQEKNEPLGFELKDVDPTHPYFKKRGITEETARYFGAGFFPGKGSMAGRVVIPIHNPAGERVAYCGRWPGDEGWPEGEEKYKLTADFKKSWELYNLHRAVATGSKVLVLVEGFFGTWKIHQAGFLFVGGLMGSSMSDEQEKLIVDHFKVVVPFMDDDQAGRSGLIEVAYSLNPHVVVWPVKINRLLYGGRFQPDQLSSNEIVSLFAAVPYL